jgi:signal transduction histidine kinase
VPGEQASEARSIVRGGVQRAEVKARRKDGTHLWLDALVSPIQFGGREYALCILRDVTDRIRIRQRDIDAHKDLVDAYDSLQAFTYVVSHDLKEPVRGVAAYLGELKADPDAPDRRELIERAHASHENLRRLLDGLLEWSRTAMTPLEPRSLRLHEVLHDPGCKAQWDTLMGERRATLTISDAIPPILGTESLVCRVFGNLITNAIRHNRADPVVTIAPGAPLRGRVEILVEDNGPGFPADLLDIGRGARTGTLGLRRGFGLTITQRALERLGGSIRLENKEGGGAIARIVLPAARLPGVPEIGSLEARVRELI